MSAHVYLAAVEDSADALGADVIQNLRRLDPAIGISGVGGTRMAREGVQSSVDTSGLSILGLFDGLAAFHRVKRIVSKLADEIEQQSPDVVVLIDAWGVMWRLARELKRREVRAQRIKLIGPQVWATRPGRARVLARWCDHLLCIHEFERPFYDREGLPTTVIGNPAIGRMRRGDGLQYRNLSGIAPTTKVVGLLLGSRSSELKRVGPIFIEAAAKLHTTYPDAKILCIPAPSVRDEVARRALTWTFEHTMAESDHDRPDAMAALDVALACSGTVTTELAEQGAAVITGYKLGWISWAIARAFLLKTRFISLINIAANKEIIPEYVQTRLTVKNIVSAATRLLENNELREAQIEAQHAIIRQLAGVSGRSAAAESAIAILRLIEAPTTAPAPAS